MRIKLLFLVCIALSSSDAFSQYDTVYVNGVPTVNRKKTKVNDEAEESPLIKDDYLLEFSYGYPFVPLREAQAFGIDLFSNTSSHQVIKNTNHICLRTGYQLGSEYSVGLELTYAQQSFEYIRKYTNYSGSTPVTTDSLFKASATKIRFLAKLEYHFCISERFDLYTTAGFGFKQFKYSTADYTLKTSNLANEISPVATRVSIGGRFFINRNFAVHVEGGFGGPMMQVGLTYKLHSYSYESKSEKTKK